MDLTLMIATETSPSIRAPQPGHTILSIATVIAQAGLPDRFAPSSHHQQEIDSSGREALKSGS
jgi:hypothetical protein